MTRFNTNNLPDYDLKDLRELCDGSPDFLNEMVLLFIRSTEEGIENIKLQLSKKEWNAIADTAHKMLGPVNHLSIHVLKNILKKIEDDIRDRQDTGEIPILVEKAEKEALRVIELLKKETNI